MTRTPFVRTPFARALTAHVRAWRQAQDGSSHTFLPTWTAGIHPAFRDLAVTLAVDDGVRLHSHAAAITSSQVFALNLFLPWRREPRNALDALLSATLREPITIDRIAFEWVPPGALLGEIDGDRPGPNEKATGVDVVLWGRDAAAKPVAVLVEVKLGEGDFTACGGRESPANHRRDVCTSAATFFSLPTACYLQRPIRKTRDRRYWEIFTQSSGSVRAAFPGASQEGPCPFATQAQPMRNLALARAIVQEGMVDRSWFALCVHDDNPDITEQWAAWRTLLPTSERAALIPASAVLAAGHGAGHGEWACWMAARYRLRPP